MVTKFSEISKIQHLIYLYRNYIYYLKEIAKKYMEFCFVNNDVYYEDFLWYIKSNSCEN